jgi:hypothetical protein
MTLSIKCLVKDCENRTDQGMFLGQLCLCCHEYVQQKNVKAFCLEGKSNGDPIPMLIHCPICAHRHIDEGEWATKIHHTHSCQHCGHTWRPAVVNTVGVKFLPGFKNT